MRIGAYLRTSTRRQDLDGQRHAVTKWGKRAKHKVTFYEDDHVTGRKTDREGIEELLAAAERGELEQVAVTELSRIGRSLSFIHTVVERLSKLGITIVLTSTGTVLDARTLEGKALIGALALAAEIEWHLLQERHARGRETIRRKGIRVGAKPKPVSAAAILALREKDMTVRQIATELKCSPATVTRRLKAAARGSP